MDIKFPPWLQNAAATSAVTIGRRATHTVVTMRHRRLPAAIARVASDARRKSCTKARKQPMLDAFGLFAAVPPTE